MMTKNRSLFAVIMIGLVSCVLYGVGAAIRTNIGILLNPLGTQTDLPYDQVSFCIAVMNLTFGASQPFFGTLASRTSNRFVLTAGSILLILSIAGMMTARSFPMLLLSLGLLFGAGGGAIAFGMVLTSAIYFTGREHAMTLSGLLNAASGMISFLLAPLMQNMLSHFGLTLTLTFLAVLAAALIPITFFITSRDPQKGIRAKQDKPKAEENDINGLALLKHAFRNRTFRLLVAGFSTCGFHMVIIESHLFSQYVHYGISETSASWAFYFYGVSTILGALLSGYLSTRVHKGHLLGFYYGFRAVWVISYLLLMPKNIITAFVFSVGLGLTGDATVSPTSGLVNQNFRLSQVATLIGFLFLCHQIGAFLSAWLGGVFFEMTGDYTIIWTADILLCSFASIMSLRISEK